MAMTATRVLVIEDDAAIRRGVVDALRFSGYECLEAMNGNQGLELALRGEYDILLLDLVLPGRGGLEILKELRGSRPQVPVIVLTARGEESDRVSGLRLGADDYVVKPFSVRELLARIEAVLRRSAERPSDLARVELPDCTVDFARREVRLQDGERRALSERESELFLYLARNAGRVVSREELLSRVWRISPKGCTTRAIDMHVARLREKIRDDAESPRILLTVRGKGYLFAGAAGERESTAGKADS